MSLKKFKVDIYFTSFCSYEISAENKDEAIKKAREQKIKETEIIAHLENWEEADTIEELSDENRKV